MKDYPESILLAGVVIAFIAGYSIVSYVINKFKEMQLHTTLKDENPKVVDSGVKDEAKQKPEANNANQSAQEK